MGALRTVRRQASGRAMPAILDHMIERVEAGSPLHVAAREYGPPFDDLMVGMLAAADATGKMTDVLHQLADLLERSIFAAPPAAAEPKTLALPPATGEEEAEVVGLPLPGPGLHVVEIESRVLGAALLPNAGPMHVAAAALVTNLAVHFKWGHESSLVWVTALDTGGIAHLMPPRP